MRAVNAIDGQLHGRFPPTQGAVRKVHVGALPAVVDDEKLSGHAASLRGVDVGRAIARGARRACAWCALKRRQAASHACAWQLAGRWGLACSDLRPSAMPAALTME